jgi:hypothetical protein
MKFAYADPPYLGCGSLYKEHHPDAYDWDLIATHTELIHDVCRTYDGWALSLSSPSLPFLLPICKDVAPVRIAAWVKPFASFKPNVNPAYTWEPVIFFPGERKRDRIDPTTKDHLACNITLKKGLTGAKPAEFCEWILDLLGFDHEQDTLDDLFPGTGIMGQVIAGRKCDASVTPLFAEGAT